MDNFSDNWTQIKYMEKCLAYSPTAEITTLWKMLKKNINPTASIKSSRHIAIIRTKKAKSKKAKKQKGKSAKPIILTQSQNEGRGKLALPKILTHY